MSQDYYSQNENCNYLIIFHQIPNLVALIAMGMEQNWVDHSPVGQELFESV